jgi:hypothetical protein
MSKGNTEIIKLEWFNPKEVTPPQLEWVLVKDDKDNVFLCQYIGDKYYPDTYKYIRDSWVAQEWCLYPFKHNSRP